MSEDSCYVSKEEVDYIIELQNDIQATIYCMQSSYGDEKREYKAEYVELNKKYQDAHFNLINKYASDEYLLLIDPMSPTINFNTGKVIFPLMNLPRSWRKEDVG